MIIMVDDYNRSRRDVLATTGASLAAATGTAGCLGGSKPEYEVEAQNLIENAIRSIDPDAAAEGNYLIGNTEAPEVHTQGEGDLNNRYWMIVDGDTDVDLLRYVSGDQFNRDDFGPATGGKLAEFVNSINTQLNSAMDERLDEFEQKYGFRPVKGNEERPEASPVLWGSEVWFNGNGDTALRSPDAYPLNTDTEFNEMSLSVEDQGAFERLF